METKISIDEWLKIKGFKLNEVQLKAIEDGLYNDGNHLLIAPTSSGKTLCAELKIVKNLIDGKNTIFLVPQKILIHKTYEDISALNGFGYKVMKAGGEYCWNEANVLILTYESFYATILKNAAFLNRFNTVILDEFHLMYDNNSRGVLLEKVITILKEMSKNLLLMSATIEDKNRLAQWLNARITYFGEEKRPIKIETKIIEKDDLYDNLLNTQFHPVLLFNNTVNWTRSRAEDLMKYIEKKEIPVAKNHDNFKRSFESLLNRELTENEEALTKLMSYGIAYHNSRLDDDIKEEIVKLCQVGKIKWLYSTTTLAMGINMPIRTVVIRDFTFMNQNGLGALPVWLYQQQKGRAGRLIKNSEGPAYCLILDNGNDFQPYLEGRLESVTSHMKEDDCFKKCLLEQIYAGKDNSEKLIGFFDNTYYNHENRSIHDRFFPDEFSLEGTIREKLIDLRQSGFFRIDGNSYRLTRFGSTVMDFLLESYRRYTLRHFMELQIFSRSKRQFGKEEFDFDFLYQLLKLFPEVKLSGVQRRVSKEIENYFEEHYPDERCSDTEYTAYAIYHGWIRGMDIKEMSLKYCIYAEPIRNVISGLIEIMDLYEKMVAIERNEYLPKEYNNLKKRVRFGIPETGEPFLLERVGRDKIMKILHRIGILIIQDGFKGLPHEYLISKGEDFTRKALMDIPGIGDETVKKVTEKFFANQPLHQEKQEHAESSAH